MKSDIEKDFLKHFEKFINYDKKLGKLAAEAKRKYALNDKLHYALKKDMNRMFYRDTMLKKHGKDLLDNANKMISLLSEEDLIFDSQEKIINEIKSAVEKMYHMEDIDQNKKIMALRLGYILKRKSDLLKQSIQAQIESFNLDKKVGKYAIKCGKGLMSIENFKDEYNSLSNKAKNFALIMKNNELIELHNEALAVMKKYEEIVNLFKKVYEN